MTYCGKERRSDYAPALLGNGEIALQLDFMDQQAFDESELDRNREPGEISRTHASRFIWWAGRRYVYDFRRFLVPFGRLLAQVEGLPDRPDDWTQTLDTLGARVLSQCAYGNEAINAEAFVHHDMNLLAIRRRFSLDQRRALDLSYCLTDNKADAPDKLPRYMRLTPVTDPITNGWRLRYSVTGQHDYEGIILIFSDRPLERQWTGANTFTLSGDVSREDVTLYVILRDNRNAENYEEVVEQQAKLTLTIGFDGLYARHKRGWDAFYAKAAST